MVLNSSGFCAWFILQHLRGYKPFITKNVFKLFLQHTNLLIFGNFYLKSLNCFHTKNQHNTKELPYYFSLPTIEKRVFQTYKVL